MKRWRAIPLGLMILAPCTGRNSAWARERIDGPSNGDYVVLIHGLGRTAWSMKRLEWALSREGYRVISMTYPSTRVSVERASGDWLAGLLRQPIADRTAKIHFVTHSLGGIILREYLSRQPIENLGRVVMLAPPNRGSELVDRLRQNWLYQRFTGPAGQQLGTEDSSLPNRIGPARFEVGIIAGDRSLNPRFSAWIPGPDDGKVSVRSTRLEGMTDFLQVHRSHTWMMWRQDVVGAVTSFLKRGCFTGGQVGSVHGKRLRLAVTSPKSSDVGS